MENESLKPKMGGTKIFALRVARPVASLAMLLGVILIFDFCIFNFYKIHPAFRANSRIVPNDLCMHRAGVFHDWMILIAHTISLTR